jgi:hypothetical protein
MDKRNNNRIKERKSNMYDEIEYQEDCISCEAVDTLNVKAIADVDSGEIVKFINQECTACGWNQQS